jgi:selenocysteine lyase/cysteine desulfurase
MSVSSVPRAAADREIRTALPVLGRDVRVPLVTGGEVTYAALDHAASAPALQRVWDDVAACAPYYGSVHRGVTGELWPVRELAAAAHRHGARIVLDAAQLAPHHPVDIAALDVDWVAFSGHKLYAPFGSGVLAGRADWLREAEPYLAGGGATRTVVRTPDGGVDVQWHTTAARHEAGSPNVIGAYAVASACRALAEAGFGRLVEREQALLARLRAGLAGVPGVRVLSLFGDDAPRVAVVSFVVVGWNSSHFAAALSAEYGIGVRDGLFCAHPLLRTLLDGAQDDPGECGAPDAAPGEASLNAIRVSFGAGTPEEHLDRFVTAVRTLVRDGAQWAYRTENGRCVPAPGRG